MSVPASLGRDAAIFQLLHQSLGKIFSRESAGFTEGLIFRTTPGSVMGAQTPRWAFLHKLQCGHFRYSSPVLEFKPSDNLGNGSLRDQENTAFGTFYPLMFITQM